MNQVEQPEPSEFTWNSTVTCKCCSATYDVTEADLEFFSPWPFGGPVERHPNDTLYLPKCSACGTSLGFNSTEEQQAIPCGVLQEARRRYLTRDKIESKVDTRLISTDKESGNDIDKERKLAASFFLCLGIFLLLVAAVLVIF